MLPTRHRFHARIRLFLWDQLKHCAAIRGTAAVGSSIEMPGSIEDQVGNRCRPIGMGNSAETMCRCVLPFPPDALRIEDNSYAVVATERSRSPHMTQSVQDNPTQGASAVGSPIKHPNLNQAADCELENAAVAEAAICGPKDMGKVVNCQTSVGRNAPTPNAEAVDLVVDPMPVRATREPLNAANPSVSRAVDFAEAIHGQFALGNRVVVRALKGVD